MNPLLRDARRWLDAEAANPTGELYATAKLIEKLADALDEREQQLREAQEAYDELYNWVCSMPDAGFSITSPRWNWWHGKPRRAALGEGAK